MSGTTEISKKVGVSVRTLQYYDDEGILALERTSKNYRVYDEDTMRRIWEILIYKEVGFKLQEIKTLFESTEEECMCKLQEQLEEVNHLILKLEVQREFLSELMEFGIPELPDVSDGRSYVDHISDLRKKAEQKLLEEEKAE